MGKLPWRRTKCVPSSKVDINLRYACFLNVGSRQDYAGVTISDIQKDEAFLQLSETIVQVMANPESLVFSIRLTM